MWGLVPLFFCSEEKSKRLFDHVDVKGNGKVDYQEWARALAENDSGEAVFNREERRLFTGGTKVCYLETETFVCSTLHCAVPCLVLSCFVVSCCLVWCCANGVCCASGLSRFSFHHSFCVGCTVAFVS